MNHYHRTKETAFEYLKRTIAAHNSDECLEWPFGRNARWGYGRLIYPPLLRSRSAHQVAYMVVHGEWPRPVGRHLCNNPPCYNPRHIVAGTYADNVADSIAAGTHRAFPIGVGNPSCKLTDDLVEAIRTGYITKSSVELAKEFGVSKPTILRIVNGMKWKHVAQEAEYPDSDCHHQPRGERHVDAKLAEEDVEHIRKSGLRVTELATMYGVHYTTISHIRAGRKWKHTLVK